MAPRVGKHVPSPDGGAGVQRVFTDLNRKFEEQEAQRRAATLSLPYFDLMGLPIDEEALDLVPHEQAESAAAVPFFKDGLLLKVAITEPQNPGLKLLLAQLAKRKFQVQTYLVTRTALAAALQQYKKILPASLSLKHEVTVTLDREVLEKFKALPTLGESLLSISASELVGLMLGAAIVMRASDIHLEPEKTKLKVRFRVDGVLAEILNFPLVLQHSLLSRIKLLSNLKLNVTAVAQDGRFTVKLPERNLEIRVSVLPSAHGESVVMRILGMQEVGLDIEKLGLHGQALKVVNHELKKPNGMILTTGPTGSGKTTTLYSFLNHLNKPGVKIITLEDPVEYQLAGIVQTPIDHTSGVDFAGGLRSILRQDPDIIMVGEIRDYETAETASQAALTGHVVLSTLHTNDAAGAIPRLLDLGVKPVTLAPALNALIAQRLLRKICLHCKELYRPGSEEMQQVKLALSRIPPQAAVTVPERLVFYHSRGCSQCHDLGYQGRIGAFEVFAVDEKIESLIFKQASTLEIKKAAVASGMLTMQQDGILKALEGITDLLEVWRVTEE